MEESTELVWARQWENIPIFIKYRYINARIGVSLDQFVQHFLAITESFMLGHVLKSCQICLRNSRVTVVYI